jgi:hypothetical protein
MKRKDLAENTTKNRSSSSKQAKPSRPARRGKKSVTLLGLDATDEEKQEALDQLYGKKK